MARYKTCWLVCCSVFCAVVCVVALVCVWMNSFVDRVQGCANGFTHAAVSADSLRCSAIGRNILHQGGSAVDGAIAALLCTSVVNPQSMGIGGGSIVTIRNKRGKVTVYNFRETVPVSFKANLLSDCPNRMTPITGSQWIGVPGELRGYEIMHKQYGKLPWAKLFEPTIKLARKGFPMPEYLSTILQHHLVKGRVESSALCEIFCHENKTVLSKGNILRYPKLADTMEAVAKQGADAFYSGKIAEDLVEDVRLAGGTLSLEDLKSFRVREEEAWSVSLGNATLHIASPPAGGALLAFMLKIMKEFPLTPKSLEGEEKILTYHRYIEAAKFANGQRRNICDPAFNKEKRADHLIDPAFINRIRGMISSNRTHDNAHYYSVAPPPDRVGTTHVSVLDEYGLAVSATSTINHLFGGMVYSSRTGVILNNELADFCGSADAVRAGEQPPSSMTPVILESKSGSLLVIGGSGGSMITTAVALSIINHLWLGMSLEEAIHQPIVFVDSQNNVNFEQGFDESVIEALKARGHKVGVRDLFFNVVNAVEKDGCIVAVSDKRKLGQPSGY